MAAIHNIQLRWMTAEQGGCSKPFGGERYATTARFVGEQDHFSVVVDFPNNRSANPPKGTLRLLNPDLVEIEQRLNSDSALEIMEGSRVVAQCVLEHADSPVIGRRS